MYIYLYIYIYICIYINIYINYFPDSLQNVARLMFERALPHLTPQIFHTLHLQAHSTGWPRPIGCLKLQVSFRTRAINYRALLQKMTCKDMASYRSSPPYSNAEARHCRCLLLETGKKNKGDLVTNKGDFVTIKGAFVTGWRRLIGSPKLQIIFHKRATKYRSLLRKTTYKDKGSYESSPPCTNKGAFVCLSTPLRERVAHRVCLSERERERTCERGNKKIQNSPFSESLSLRERLAERMSLRESVARRECFSERERGRNYEREIMRGHVRSLRDRDSVSLSQRQRLCQRRRLCPHEKPLGILRVSIPATTKDLAARTWGCSGTNPK